MSINPTPELRALFVTIASSEIGFGHLNRCISIAATPIGKKIVPSFLVFGDDSANQVLRTTAYQFELHHGANILETCSKISNAPTQHYDLAIIDIAHPLILKPQTNLKALFKVLSGLAKRTAALDSLGKDSIAIRSPKALLNTLVVPYVINDDALLKLKNVHAQCLYGIQYALLSSAYLQCAERSQRQNANRILIVSGGSDPKQFTPVVLRALEKIEIDLEIRVVIGPLFSKHLTKLLVKISDNSTHKISLLLSPNSLKEHMLWSDLTISASGLTKYELAATGTPSILFSIDEKHDFANKAFANLETSIDLGVLPNHERVTKTAHELLTDTKLRNQMSIRGQQAVDGKGSARLLTELTKDLTC